MKFSVNIRGPKEEQSILDARSRSSKESGRVILVGYLTLTREGKTDLAMSNGNSSSNGTEHPKGQEKKKLVEFFFFKKQREKKKCFARYRKPTSGSEFNFRVRGKTNNHNDGAWEIYQRLF